MRDKTLVDSVISELEGTLLKNKDPFSYFMLIAFEASGLLRFTILLLFWPIIRLLNVFGNEDYGLKLTIFVATVGLRIKEIESVSRAVLPKFYLDDVDMEAWRLFSGREKRVVVTKMPRVMVERFVKEHLRGDEIIGSDLVVNRFGFAMGLVNDDGGSVDECVLRLFDDEKPCLGLGRLESGSSFLSLCKVSYDVMLVFFLFGLLTNSLQFNFCPFVCVFLSVFLFHISFNLRTISQQHDALRRD